MQQQHLLQVRDHQGNTALHLAAMEGILESVQLLLQAGAAVNVPGKHSPQTVKPGTFILLHVWATQFCSWLQQSASWSSPMLI